MNTIEEILKNAGGPLSAAAVTKKMKLDKSQLPMVKAVLDSLVRRGEALCDKGVYTLYRQEGFLEGTVLSTASGSDFFSAPSLKEDLKIINSRDLHVMHRDTVLVRPKGRHCEVVRILNRAWPRVIGTICRENSAYIVVPDEKKLHEAFVLPKKERTGLHEGDKVVAAVTSYPSGRAAGLCKITEVLGKSDNDDTAILAVLRTYGIEDGFSSAVLDDAERVSARPLDFSGRLDLRKLMTVTIDGDDSKDFDDAVSLEITERGHYLLGVHIADVSSYVLPDSPLDREAFKRSTSVYLPGTVYPMLPPALSNGICSLNENEDRLAISCFMMFTHAGKLLESSIQPSVIRSKHRLTYRNVSALLEDRHSPLRTQYADIVGMLLLMNDLASALKKNAAKRGSIDFDLPETSITLDETGFPVAVERAETSVSHGIIEQFMLSANQTVAAFMKEHQLPCLYRVHQPPEDKKLSAFRELIGSLGLTLPEDPKPMDFRDLLQKIAGRPEENLIQKAMLRTMSKAKYLPTCDGHFGLAMDDYLHFTSPIRRYPDLIVHRVLHWYWENRQKPIDAYREDMAHFAEVTSSQEQNAAACERDVDDIRKAQYLSRHIGENYEGMISGVTAFGLYVMLPNTCEGFIPVYSLDGYFSYDETAMALVGDDIRYTLGDPVTIRVFGVSIPEGKAEFSLFS